MTERNETFLSPLTLAQLEAFEQVAQAARMALFEATMRPAQPARAFAELTDGELIFAVQACEKAVRDWRGTRGKAVDAVADSVVSKLDEVLRQRGF